MKNDDIKILVADDNEDNRWLAVHGLESRLEYKNVIEKADGVDAYDYVSHNPNDVDIILLDRMMPHMSGVEMYHKMQNKPDFKDIIIIFQTGRSAPEELTEIINMGAEYMLRKPYDPEDMGAFVEQASCKIRRLRNFKKILANKQPSTLLESYTLKTFNEAEKLVIDIISSLNKTAYDAEALYGLIENAIEHGNLEIFEQKEDLLKEGTYFDEIDKRLNHAEYTKRDVKIKLEKDFDLEKITIEDGGKGFDPSPFYKINADRLIKSHGRGILHAKNTFKKVEYSDKGNIVCVWI